MDDNHKRILQVRLLLIEKHLRNILHNLENDANSSTFILYSIKNTIDHDLKARLINIINSMFNEIAQMKIKFKLESEEQSAIRSILGNLDEIWTTLEDTRPEKLAKGYGSISKVGEELLRPCVLKLLLMIDNIYTELRYTRSNR